MSSIDDLEQDGESSGIDGARLEEVRRRLNEAFLETHQGEYFRSRVRGWLAERAAADVALPGSLAQRLGGHSPSARSPASLDASSLDAFVVTYHAAESFVRYLLATVDGSGPDGAPLMAIAQLRARAKFDKRLRALLDTSSTELSPLLDWVFLPDELKRMWSNEPPAIHEVQTYCHAWVRHLVRFTIEWRNAYNAAKHGLA